MEYQRVSEMVGGTPHLRVEAAELPMSRIFAKLEGWNPTGSVKDRAGLLMIQNALDSGALRPGMTLIDASSGNMACSLTYFGRVLGYPTAVVVSSKLTEDKRSFLKWFGATIHTVGDLTIEGNRWCRELVEREGGDQYCFLDQLHNWANPQAHYVGTGPEILAAFPGVRMVVGSLGSGGTLYGTARFLKEHRPDVRVVAVESEVGTKLPGVGAFAGGDYVTPFIAKGWADGIFDEAVRVTADDAVRGTLRLRDIGVFCGMQTGAVFHAAVRAVRAAGVAGDVVFISGDAGWKNFDKLLPHAPGEAPGGQNG